MIRSMAKQSYIILVIFGILLGCNLSTAPVALPTPTSQSSMPSVRLAQAEVTVVPTIMRSIPTLTPSQPTDLPATPTLPPYDCDIVETAPIIQHTVAANIDFLTRQVDVAQEVQYVNRTNESLGSIVLDVQPNIWENGFQLAELRSQNLELDYTLSLNRLEISLPQPLQANCAIELQIAFLLNPPQVAAGSQAYRGFFGYSARQLNLALWLPTVAPFRNGDWLIHDPVLIGEQVVLEQADWEVTLTVNNSERPLILAAPGTIAELGENRWRVIFRKGRDFTVSLSADFIVNGRQTPSGVTVEVYTFPDAVGQVEGTAVNGATHTLDAAYKSVIAFEKLFGAFPYERMLVVQGDFPDGMEFSGIVYVSTAWFYYFDGTPANYLTIITVHEVSHQWWYARVGNDAAQNPWLDESLATYSEYVYYEEYYPDLKDWWWQFRVATFNPQGDVDSTVYEFSNARQYINATYLRGAQMLHNLREDIGTEEFFDLLNAYAQAGDGDIATPELFWSLLSEEQAELTIDTRTGFLREPNLQGN